MRILPTVLALLLLIDVSLWAVGSISLWRAARKTAVLQRLLEEVQPGEAQEGPTLPMFARSSKLDEKALHCAHPTKKWLMVPVLGPLMISKQHHLYAKCLQAKLEATAILKKRHTWSLRFFLYLMALVMMFGTVNLPFDIKRSVIALLLGPIV